MQSFPAAIMRTSRRRPNSAAAFGILISVLAAAALDAHALSVSYAHVAIQPRSIEADVRLPLDDVDLLLRVDRDLDGRVSPAEIEAARAALSAYLVKHTHIAADAAVLTPAIGRLNVWRDASGFEYLEAGLVADAGRPLRIVSIRTDYLVEPPLVARSDSSFTAPRRTSAASPTSAGRRRRSRSARSRSSRCCGSCADRAVRSRWLP